MSAPTADALEAMLAPMTQVSRRANIYEADGTTLFAEDVAFDVQGGTVTVSYEGDARRSLALSIHDEDGQIEIGPTGLWYDKIIKVWRGVQWDDEEWETPLGEFYVDNIRQKYHPHTLVQINGRDAVKKALMSKFGYTTNFASGYNVGDLIIAIAANAGITKTRITSTPESTGREFQFDGTTARWAAMKEIATAFSYELFVDNDGYLILRKFRDPATSPLIYSFQVGRDLVSYEKLLNDSFLFNHVIVVGEATDTIPVSAEAINTAPSSPTSVARIGDRTNMITSALVTTDAQAQELADVMLSISKLESYEINWSAIVVPSLEVGDIVEFVDPYATVDQPTRFLLTDLSIPLSLGPMTATGKRLEIIS